MYVLVVNAGSSSLKYQLMDTATETVLAKGLCERIGIDGSIEHKNADGDKIVRDLPMPNHSVAIQIVVDTLTDPEIGCIKDMSQIEAVGHRAAHGGNYFSDNVLIEGDVMERFDLCREIAPLHTGPHIMGIEGCTAVMPNVPQVIVFDTVFHKTMPDYAYMYALPYEMYEKYSIRRYGFHGTSHGYVANEMAKVLGRPIEETKIITCHIGNGSSITAVNGGKCVDTSMGFTPLAGVEMGTRCGDIDPAIVTYIMDKEGYTPDEMSNFMNKKSGLLGVSGISSDSRDIEAAVKNGDYRATLAANMLGYGIKKYIGSYIAAMNGVDAIVFTAGMGENNSEMRERVCTDMEFFGIKIDLDANAKTYKPQGPMEISTPDSKVKVFVIPTNEELMIARETDRIVSARK
jgi:acetate kinase